MKRLALIPVLMLLAGCPHLFYSYSRPPTIVMDSNHVWARYPEDWETVRTIRVPQRGSDAVVPVLMWGNDEVLEIECDNPWSMPIGVDSDEEWIYEEAMAYECDTRAIFHCQDITQDARTTIRRYAFLSWKGVRRRPAVYVQCLTPAKLRDYMSTNGQNVKVAPEHAQYWKWYLREVGAN